MDPRLAAAVAAQRGQGDAAAADGSARDRMVQALLSGVGAAGDTAKGVIGSMFSPQANMQRAERFMTGIDPATGEDLTERPLLPNAENGGRLGEIAAFIQGNGMRAPMGAERTAGMTLGSGPVIDPKALGLALSRDLPMDEASRMGRAAEQGYSYARRSRSETSPFNQVGWAMFKKADGDVDNALDYLSSYGKGQWLATDRDAVDAADIQKDIVRALRTDGLHDEYQTTAASLARQAAPPDIVNSAGLWDAPDLVRSVWTRVLEPKGIGAVKTPDGMLVFDPRHIRSREAAFDPAKVGSDNLMASGGPAPSPNPNFGAMDVNAAYEATKSEDPEVRRRAMMIYALRGGA